MKHKTADLEGAHLNAAVAKAEGLIAGLYDNWIFPDGRRLERALFVQTWLPAYDWSVGGPIIERELIAVVRLIDCQWHAWHHIGWGSYIDSSEIPAQGIGPTPLIAAMRAYVASRLGEEVELP